MEYEPEVGDLALVATSGNLGLVVRVDGGWYYLTFEDSDWETYFRRDQIRVISKG